MKKDKTLLIMAAGMGSRFGGLKQIEPFGPNGEFIIDYSIYDALRNGFNKVVFIIKEENYEVFKNTIGKRVEKRIPTFYAFQSLTDIPSNGKVPIDRKAPWGTGQAILTSKKYIDEDFVVINADDFYGEDAYKQASLFLDNNASKIYANICYNVENTLTLNGSVKRGVCEVEDGYLKELIESKIEKIDGEIVAEPLNGEDKFIIDSKALVSMNMFVFDKSIFKYLEEGFVKFFDRNKDDLTKCEFLLPDVIREEMKNGNVKVKAINTSAVWHGVTYKEDKEQVVEELNKLIDNGCYPKNLWEE